MATLSAYLPAEDAVGVYAVLDEYARRAKASGDERNMDAVAVMLWSIWCWVRSAPAVGTPAQPGITPPRSRAASPMVPAMAQTARRPPGRPPTPTLD